MADIYQTINSFETASLELKITNETIASVLQLERDLNALYCKNEMHLFLPGNLFVNNKANRLGDDDMKVFDLWLSENTYVVVLDLRYNSITDKGALYLAKLLCKNKGIKELNLMFNDIGREGAQLLAASLHKNRTLKILRMTGNKIKDRGGLYFVEALQVNENVNDLDLGDCDVGIHCIIGMNSVLRDNKTLEKVNLSRPLLKTVEEDIFNHYAQMLRMNKHLKELHMRKHGILHLGAHTIAESLFNNQTLTYLDLSCNRITLAGATMLAELLKKNTPLETLDLGLNLISDQGAIEIAQSLATYNTHLIRLSVVKNELRGRGMCSLAHCLYNNQTLKEIYISGNRPDESSAIAFKKVIMSGRLELDNTDVVPYTTNNGVTQLAFSNKGINIHYYWMPTYGEHAGNSKHSVLRCQNLVQIPNIDLFLPQTEEKHQLEILLEEEQEENQNQQNQKIRPSNRSKDKKMKDRVPSATKSQIQAAVCTE